jgi:hypothetical protein
LSILIHDGYACKLIILKYLESGHYFCYIHDYEKKIWRKYNDMQVSEETEENVLKNSKGSFIKIKFQVEKEA